MNGKIKEMIHTQLHTRAQTSNRLLGILLNDFIAIIQILIYRMQDTQSTDLSSGHTSHFPPFISIEMGFARYLSY